MIVESMWIQLVSMLRRPGQLAPLVITPLHSLVFFAVAHAHGASTACQRRAKSDPLTAGEI